jgi:hypothetical protein
VTAKPKKLTLAATKPRLNPAAKFKLQTKLTDLAGQIEKVPGEYQRRGMAMRLNALAPTHGVPAPLVRI